jgi:putative nucleotidyltransferase with HDIG domain
MAIPEKLIDGIQRLAPLPMTVQKLAAALQDEDVPFRQIAGILEYDGAVAANVLKVANSGAYGGRFRTETIRDAVIRLGSANLLNIILGDYLKSLQPAAPMYSLTENDFWFHSAASSLAVKALTIEAKPSLIPQSAGIAALLHDIGKLVIARYMQVDCAAILAVAEEKKIPFVEAERELVGSDHTEIGGEISRKWHFPEEIALAIACHHSPVDDATPMTDVVMLANLAAKSVGAGMGADGMNFRVDYSHSRERLGLSIKAFERACAQTAVWLHELRDLNNGGNGQARI